MIDTDREAHELRGLVLAAASGSVAAFEELVTRYHVRLCYYVARLLGDQDGAQDVMQLVWVQVWRDLPRLREAQAFTVWAYKIARNQALRELRRKNKDYLFRAASLEEVPEPATDTDAFSPEDAAEIHSALGRLSPEHRDVLTLRFMEEMDYVELAQVLGVNVGTVRSRLHYAKRALREEIEAIRKAQK